MKKLIDFFEERVDLIMLVVAQVWHSKSPEEDDKYGAIVEVLTREELIIN